MIINTSSVLRWTIKRIKQQGMKLTKEQYDALTPYKDALRSAYKNSFVRINSADFNAVATIYNQLFPPLRKSQMACNTCRLNSMKKLGELYESYEQTEEKKEKKERTKKLAKNEQA